MKRLKCLISYDGSRFSGFQIQPNKRTIQGEIEKALMKMHKQEYIRIYGSGRTDAGVHAKGQVFHFDTHLVLNETQWHKALNALLPNDIFIRTVEKVPQSFHARFDATEKEYRYYVLNSRERNVFKRNYSYYNPQTLDMSAIQAACQKFEGTHDFTSFCSSRTAVKGDKIRTLYEVSCSKNEEEIEFILRGNGFLYNMVRIIIGVLIDVGLGKVHPDDIEKMFLKKDRTAVGKTLPPEGLFLWNVTYNDKII